MAEISNCLLILIGFTYQIKILSFQKRILMKNFKLIIGVIICISLITSCKKTVTDDTAKFIGTWAGTFNMNPGAGSGSPSSNSINIAITKGTAVNQIILTQTGSTVSRTANANGNGYTYVEFNSTSTTQGITISMKMNGSGSLSGTTITESGTEVITVAGVDYPGTWSSTMTKQ